MPHRPEDTSMDHPGEVRNPAVEGTHYQGPRTTADTQPPAPANRPRPGSQPPRHGSRELK